MAKIRVEAYNTGPYKTSINGKINFSLVSSPKNGRCQIIDFMGCKAYLHDAVQAHVLDSADYGSHYKKGKNPPVDIDKLRLLVGSNSAGLNKFKEKLFAAKKMLNLFEKAAGWKPSKITTVEHSTIDEGVWLITGPKQWVRSPQMLSMVTLIIRVAIRRGPVNPKDEKEATALLKKWADNSTSYGDSGYLYSCWDKLFLIMKNYERLFGGITIEDRYKSGQIGSHSNGIANWCLGKAGLAELNKRIKGLCKEHKVPIREGYY